MVVPSETFSAKVGDPEPWIQRVRVQGTGAGSPAPLTITPTSGYLTISYFDDAGQEWWWDAVTETFLNTETLIVCTPDANAKTSSYLAYVHQPETAGKTVTMRGWIGAGGNPPDENTAHVAHIRIDPAEVLFVSSRG